MYIENLLKKRIMNDLSIIVYSCFRNSDMWRIFSASMKKYWGDRTAPLILVTDRYEEFEDLLFDKVVCIDSDWVTMISTAIRESKTKYVMLFMDDYLLTEVIDENELDKCIKIMEQSNALCIHLSGGNVVVGLLNSQYPNVSEYPQQSAYCLSLHACVWNSKLLLDLLDGKKWSAWDFERIGSMEYNDVAHPILVTNDYKFPYIEGVRKGKWLPDGVRWCRQNNITIDFMRRPAFSIFERMIIEGQGLLLHLFPNVIVKVQNLHNSKKQR